MPKPGSWSKKYSSLVDDHQIVLDGLQMMLSKNNEICILSVFQSAQMAYDYITQNYEKIDVVLTDISMPILSGIELCKKIKQFDQTIKVLILSMYNSSEVIREAIMADTDGYLLKNSNIDELLQAIKKLYMDGTYFGQDVIPLLSPKIEPSQSKKQLDIINSPKILPAKRSVNNFLSVSKP
jgi:two-component system, NarL family, nitrate/nitrite response regulator NarL